MAIADDFTVYYTPQKRVRHTSGTAIYSVNALYSYLQDLFDELTQLDDTVPMSAQTPNEYTLINGWFMDDTSFEYLASGSIQTSGYSGSVYRLDFQAGSYTNCGDNDLGLPVTGTAGATIYSASLLDFNNSTRTWWVRASSSTDTFSSTSMTVEVFGGTGSAITAQAGTTGEDLWANIYTLGTIRTGSFLYVVQSGSKLTSWWPGGHIDILVKVKKQDSEIDDGNLTIFAREYTHKYDYFEIDVTAGGRNAVPLATSNDLNNNTSGSTVDNTYGGITIASVNGKITYISQSGNFTVGTYVTGGTSGATAYIAADSDQGTTGTLTLANISGANFTNGEELTASGSAAATASALVTSGSGDITVNKDLNNGNGNRPYSVIIDASGSTVANMYEYLKYVTRRGSTFKIYAENPVVGIDGEQYKFASASFTPVKEAPFGTFAGSKFFGAQGVWIQNYANADAQNFQLIDSNGVTQVPPNTVTITVSSVVSGDRVAVFVLTAANGSIDKSTYTASGSISGSSTLTVSQSIATDTPTAGVLRISDRRYSYSSYSGSVFTLSTPLSESYDTGSGVYVPIIDQQASSTSVSNTLIYSSDIPVLVRVRKKGILPFEVESTVTSTGLSVSAIRTTDSIVT